MVLALCSVVACGEDKEPLVTASGTLPDGASDPSDPSSDDPSNADDGDSADDDDEPTSGEPTGDETSDEPVASMRTCELYLDCLAVISPNQLPEAQQGFGPDGTPCAGEGCCTKLCDFRIPDACPNGRECVSLAAEGFRNTESLKSYLGLCMPA